MKSIIILFKLQINNLKILLLHLKILNLNKFHMIHQCPSQIFKIKQYHKTYHSLKHKFKINLYHKFQFNKILKLKEKIIRINIIVIKRFLIIIQISIFVVKNVKQLRNSKIKHVYVLYLEDKEGLN